MKKVVFTVINDLVSDQRMRRICSSLATNGYEVVLIGRVLPGSADLSDQSYQQLRLKCHFNKGKLFYLEYNLRLTFMLLNMRLNILSAVDLDTLSACTLVSIIRQKKLVFDAHEYFEQVPEVIHRPATQRVWSTVAHRFIPKATACYTVGPALAAEFKKVYGKEFGVVMNAPRWEGNFIVKEKKEKIYLYQGALNQGRGLETYIRVMENIDGILWIVGEGDLSSALRAQAAKSKAASRIVFKGFVKPADLKQLTASAKVGLNVSENLGISYYLSLNNKFFDYIHAGLPSVINPFPEYIALNDKYGVGCYADCREDSIIEALETMNNDELYSSMTQACMKAAAELNWQVEEKKLLDIYGDIS